MSSPKPLVFFMPFLTSSSALATPPESPSTAAQPSLRARLDVATMAILQTRDQVVKSLDKHLQELHALRRAMGEGDTSLMAMLPAAPRAVPSPAGTSSVEAAARPPAPTFHERAPAIQSAPLPASPFLNPIPPLDNLAPVGLEKATLEELNAALAFAFAHVSNAQRVPQPQPPVITRR